MVAELRRDYFGNYVIISKERAFRPKNLIKKDSRKKGAFCPFCLGHESSTPPETARVSKNGQWVIRSFYNKYPLSSVHEVIVESANDKKRFSEFTLSELIEVFKFYQNRFRSITGSGYPFFFKNEGALAGASIPHTHSQLITLSVRNAIASLEESYLNFNNIFEKERNMIILKDNFFFSYCPWASRNELEAWIVCRRKGSSLTDLDNNELRSVCKQLRHLIGRLDKKLGKPAYNLIYHDAVNFHIHIYPRINNMAGLELGGNIYVNEIPP